MCVPTLPLRRRAASGFVLFSFSAVGVLKRRGDLRADWCVFWQRASWQNRPSALGKNLLRPRTTRPSWCLFRPHEKQKDTVPVRRTSSYRRWQETSATSGRQHVSRPQRLVGGKMKKKKIPDPNTQRGETRRSSLLGAPLFPARPIVPPTGKCFCADDKLDVFSVTRLFWQEREKRGAAGKCWALRKTERRIAVAICRYWTHTYYDSKYRGPYVRTEASLSSVLFWVSVGSASSGFVSAATFLSV